MATKTCPQGHRSMELKKLKKKTTIRDVDMTVDVAASVCPECGMTASDIKAVAKVQRQMADEYRKAKNLLTGDEIRGLRQGKKLTQEALADLMGVGVASIKRWELGNIQSVAMDNLLRTYLKQNCGCSTDIYTGNRPFSMPRIKMVAKQFEKVSGKRLLMKGGKFLFLAKYLWYADMVAYRELGRSMTGSTYAALSYGPQLNNYKDIMTEVKKSDASSADPLSQEEHQIINKIVKTFPTEKKVYDAAHHEQIWRETPTGAMIPYTLASMLTEI